MKKSRTEARCLNKDEEIMRERERERDCFNARGRRETSFFFIKVMCWVATVLPNALGSTVASQATPWIMRNLLWHAFCNFFSNFLYFRE